MRPGWIGRTALASLAACAAALGLASVAEAGYGVFPNGQSIPVQVDGGGAIASPRSVDVIVYLDALDTEAAVWVSESPHVDAAGRPAGGSAVASCAAQQLQPWVEAGKYLCAVGTGAMRPGRTYYWWLTFRRRDSANAPRSVSGPFAFTLAAATPPPTPPPAAPERRTTYASAASLPAHRRFDATRSVKRVPLTRVLYRTLKLAGSTRVLAVACWSAADYQLVYSSIGGALVDDGSTHVAGFWYAAQPRWLHLSPGTCANVQRLFDTRRATAAGGFALTTALHEALHAHGVADEAMSNCYAVQLVPYAATYIGLRWRRARYLGKLALNATRRTAPVGYWDASRCRDGGAWDLLPQSVNLR